MRILSLAGRRLAASIPTLVLILIGGVPAAAIRAGRHASTR